MKVLVTVVAAFGVLLFGYAFLDPKPGQANGEVVKGVVHRPFCKDRCRFEVAFEMRTAFLTGGLLGLVGEAQKSHVNLRCVVDFDLVKEGRLMRLDCQHVELGDGSEKVEALSSDLSSEINQTFQVKKGEVVSQSVVGFAGQQVVREFVALFSQGGASVWDSVGEVRFVDKALPVDSGVELQRSVGEYTKLNLSIPGVDLRHLTSEHSGKIYYAFNQSGQSLSAARGRWGTKIFLNGKNAVEIMRSVRIASMGRPLKGGLRFEASKHRFLLNPKRYVGAMGASKVFAGAALEVGDDIYSVLDQADSSLRGEVASTALRSKLLGKMQGLFATDPASIDKALVEVRELGVEDLRLWLTIHALGFVGTAQSQEALADYLSSWIDDQERVRLALNGSFHLKEPRVEMVAEVEKVREKYTARQEGADATLILGSFLGRSSSGLVRKRILGSLEPLLTHTDLRERLLGIKAFGNSGKFDEKFQSLIGDPSPLVRAEVIMATRLLVFEDRRAFIEAGLDDEHREVRRRAIEAMGFRPLTKDGFELLATHLLVEEEDHLRIKIIQLLYQDSGYREKARSQIESFAQHDPSFQVRREARRLLEKGGVK